MRPIWLGLFAFLFSYNLHAQYLVNVTVEPEGQNYLAEMRFDEQGNIHLKRHSRGGLFSDAAELSFKGECLPRLKRMLTGDDIWMMPTQITVGGETFDSYLPARYVPPSIDEDFSFDGDQLTNLHLRLFHIEGSYEVVEIVPTFCFRQTVVSVANKKRPQRGSSHVADTILVSLDDANLIDTSVIPMKDQMENLRILGRPHFVMTVTVKMGSHQVPVHIPFREIGLPIDGKIPVALENEIRRTTAQLGRTPNPSSNKNDLSLIPAALRQELAPLIEGMNWTPQNLNGEEPGELVAQFLIDPTHLQVVSNDAYEAVVEEFEQYWPYYQNGPAYPVRGDRRLAGFGLVDFFFSLKPTYVRQNFTDLVKLGVLSPDRIIACAQSLAKAGLIPGWDGSPSPPPITTQ